MDTKPIRERKMRKKWASLEKRGIFPPKSQEENQRRAKDAHGG